MRVTERQAGDKAELATRARVERRAIWRDRYRAVGMALDGADAPTIARTLGRSRRPVQRWVYAYRDRGIDGLLPGKATGRPTKLPRDKEAAFVDRMDAGPTEADDGVCTLRGKDAVAILGKEFGVKYTLDGAYDLLHRLGYSCLVPRPKHEKNDPAKMVEFEQVTAPLL